jgi:hypothetical protein
MRAVPWPDDIAGHGGLGVWLVRLLDGPPTPRSLVTGHLAVSPHPPTRIWAIRAGYEIAEQWRSTTGGVVAMLAQRLTDPDPSVARVAARYLGRVGVATKPVADALAAALHHADAEVRASMTVGLAHCGDHRAVATLVGLLGHDRCPWPAHTTWGDDIRSPVHVLDALRPHATQLLPALLARLHDGGEGWDTVATDLVRGLGTWGVDAGDAAPAVAALLIRGPVGIDTVVTTLGRIGPAAAFAVPVLDTLAEREDKHAALIAWAYWRITGEQPDTTAATLARLAATPRHGPQALRLLADLGPAAAGSADSIRTLLASRDRWTRVEAAHALWRASGDLRDALPVLLDEAGCVDHPDEVGIVRAAAFGYLGQIGALAAEAIPALEAVLRRDRRVGGTGHYRDDHNAITWDQHCQQLVTAALDRLRGRHPD